MKTLILYAYCENQSGPTSCKNSHENLRFFLDHGLINNSDYQFCINVNGKSTFDFSNYLEKFENLKIFYGQGKCAYDGWNNILNNNDDYDYFIFLKDKVRGPYHIDKINDWINYFISHINDENKLICCGFGVSPEGKLYKFPYFTEKCFCIDRDIYTLLKNNKFLNKISYDCRQKMNNFENSLEISFSKFLLDNNIEYSSIDNNKITKLDILKHYKQNNFTELFEITKNYFKLCNSNIPKKIFWTSSTMKKIEEDNNFINLLNKNRDPTNLKKW